MDLTKLTQHQILQKQHHLDSKIELLSHESGETLRHQVFCLFYAGVLSWTAYKWKSSPPVKKVLDLVLVPLLFWRISGHILLDHSKKQVLRDLRSEKEELLSQNSKL